MTQPTAIASPAARAPSLILLFILLGSFLLKLNHLSHAAIHTPDEIISAQISRNLLKHPLVPTLVDQAFLPADDTDWQSAHLWIFKPPMAFWQIAVFFKFFGINTLMLRLPSAILSTLAVMLTYLIGAQWTGKITGLVAAGLQAFSPAIVSLVQGYLFSDHIDVTLLFWTEFAIYFLGRAMMDAKPRRLDLILCGVAQGFAILSKWHLALLVTGLVVVAWALPKMRLVGHDEPRLAGRGLLIILISTILTIAPWLIYIELRFPHQLAFINRFVFQHLNQNMSNWAGPWDRLLFDYTIQIFYVYYPAVLAAMVWTIPYAFKQRKIGIWLMLAWAIGVFVPNVLAETKTPSSTLIGWPACWLILGFLVERACEGDRWAMGIWLVSMLLPAALLTRSAIPQQTMGYENYLYPGYLMVQNLWVIGFVLGALAGGWLMGSLLITSRNTQAFSFLAGALTIFLAIRWWGGSQPESPPLGYVQVAWRVTQFRDRDKNDFSSLGSFANTLPANAVFIVDERVKSESFLLQFAADRTCYAAPGDWRVMANQLIAVGAIPYFVTPEKMTLPALFTDEVLGRTIYACPTPAATLWR